MSRKPSTSNEGWEILKRIRKIKPFVQASLTVTKKKCGNPKCRCVQEGPIHEVSYLTWKENQTTRTLYVSKDMRSEVLKWVEEGKRLKKLIAEMSEAQKKFLKELKNNKI
jgi:hypothetical protein